MISPFSTSSTLSCATINTIPILLVTKSLPCRRWPDVICHFFVLDATSGVRSARKLKSGDFTVCLPSFVARASVDDDSRNSLEADDSEEDGKKENQNELFYSKSPGDAIEIEIENTGKNCRRIRSEVAVKADLQTIWELLTDYEKLADIFPGLAVSQLLEKSENFARLFQIGEQNLAFGLKFNAKGTIDCFEKDLLTIPSGRKREIEFKMIDGDFEIFEGKWSIEQVKGNPEPLSSDFAVVQDFQTKLLYVVDVKPKLWLPVGLVEGRICREIKVNLSCIRQEAEKSFKTTNCAS